MSAGRKAGRGHDAGQHALDAGAAARGSHDRRTTPDRYAPRPARPAPLTDRAHSERSSARAVVESGSRSSRQALPKTGNQ